MASGGGIAPRRAQAAGRIGQAARRAGLSAGVGLTLLVSAGGALLARHYGLPGGVLIGALVAAAVARLLGAPLDEPPEWLRIAGRIVLGLTIGATVTPSTLQSVARAMLPVTLLLLVMVVLGLLTAFAIHRFTRMPLPTALCSTTPGAIAPMIALAGDLGGDAAVAASMQLVRLLGILAFVPAFVRGVVGGAPAVVASLPAAEAAGGAPLSLAALLVLGVLAGVAATRLRVPGGDLLAGLAVAALANPIWLRLAGAPEPWGVFAQWILGAAVGATITRSALRTFRPYALAGGLMTASLIGSGLALGWALSRVTALDLATCITGSAPGGADTMIVLAADLGADVHLVTAMHVSRQIILMLLLPVLARIAAGKPTAEAQNTT